MSRTGAGRSYDPLPRRRAPLLTERIAALRCLVREAREEIGASFPCGRSTPASGSTTEPRTSAARFNRLGLAAERRLSALSVAQVLALLLLEAQPASGGTGRAVERSVIRVVSRLTVACPCLP